MAIPESTSEKNIQTPPKVRTTDVDDLRRRRQQAFREVGFESIAEQKAVNGYSSIATPSSAVEFASESCLSTPLIDISNLGKSTSPMRQQQTPHRSYSSPLAVSPEAGLHRDGEQARLVEAVRRRQLQEQQHYEDNTLEWLEDAAAELWESILIYGGIMEDPRTNQRSMHSTSSPANPYRDNNSSRDNSRATLKSNGSGKSLSSSRKSTKNDQLQPITNGPSAASLSLPKHRRIIRFFIQILLRIAYAFRWSIDAFITCLARIEPLPPNSFMAKYSKSPIYSLHMTADDVLLYLILLSVFHYCILWMKIFEDLMVQRISMVFMMCSFLALLSRKVVGRSQYVEGERQVEQHTHQQNFKNQPIKRKESAKSSIIQSNDHTPMNSISANFDQRHSGAMERLQKQYPDATKAEVRRFFTCVKFNEEAAGKRMDEYFKWRSNSGLKIVAQVGTRESSACGDRIYDQTFVENDADVWNTVSKIAVSIITKTPVTESTPTLPQIVCSYEEKLEEESMGGNNKPKNVNSETSASPPPRCEDGTRIFQMLAARLDLTIATAPTYSLAAALYLDRRFSRSTSERITLLVDCRGKKGWANPTPWSLLPFVQSTASLLGSHYPERLERLILFPIPQSAIWVWSAAQKFLDPDTASKVVVLGDVDSGSGSPEGMTTFFHEERYAVLEKRRRSFYVDSD
mmetsp:Transcript_31876/g.67512  ORF Transcript_31876/g.67512 Transcript_31876/m.67512 type:complete len:686 (+) Transcript_31876:219-2276(+)